MVREQTRSFAAGRSPDAHLLPDDTPMRFSQDGFSDTNDLHPSLSRADASYPPHNYVSDLNHLVRRPRLFRLRYLKAPTNPRAREHEDQKEATRTAEKKKCRVGCC